MQNKSRMNFYKQIKKLLKQNHIYSWTHLHIKCYNLDIAMPRINHIISKYDGKINKLTNEDAVVVIIR